MEVWSPTTRRRRAPQVAAAPKKQRVVDGILGTSKPVAKRMGLPAWLGLDPGVLVGLSVPDAQRQQRVTATTGNRDHSSNARFSGHHRRTSAGPGCKSSGLDDDPVDGSMTSID